MTYHTNIETAKNLLIKDPDASFKLLIRNGTMKVEYYSPQKTDNQIPHKQDEIYVIATGSGNFNRNGEIIKFRQGDVFFVPAGMEHKFENFSNDFATWVIFYGVGGGEKP